MQIRVERPGDEAAIYDLVSAAFGKRDEADLVDALRIGGTIPSMLSPKTEATLLAMPTPKLIEPEKTSPSPRSLDPRTDKTQVSAARLSSLPSNSPGAAAGRPPLSWARPPITVASASISLPLQNSLPIRKKYFIALELSPGTLARAFSAIIYPSPFSKLS